MFRQRQTNPKLVCLPERGVELISGAIPPDKLQLNVYGAFDAFRVSFARQILSDSRATFRHGVHSDV